MVRAGKNMELKELLEKTRSIRRFDPKVRIPLNELHEMVSYVRLCPSAGNFQPLRFFCISDRETCGKIFRNLRWAARLKNWEPSEIEQPGAYILILTEKSVAAAAPYDSGIAAHTILMAAALKGYGGCMLGSIDRREVASILSIDTEKYAIDLAVAVGAAAEKSVIEECTGDTCYRRAADGTFYVPKRSTESVILEDC